ncbi:DUF2357 domain-containing protein [Clostridium sp.]|uniref:DUF2357 domain-containing protein n=1 Tax=Clostridium sp. TaxID=1506 RepID=UPI002602B8D2|nr:DUF2357 domain-containing protein [uncultured Clostridium sp.]
MIQLVSVRPDWSDATDLLGYRNIENKFVPGIIIDAAYEAMKNIDKPYFLCLDEMNLVRVEYYFSDILSSMETRNIKDDEIITQRLLSRAQFGKDERAYDKYGDVYIPQNLYIIGTVNMDETTFSFSKKVLDRANTIEFNKVDLRYNSELLFIETEEVYFSIKGNSGGVGYGESKSLTIMVEGKEQVEETSRCLYFKEYTNYEIVIERKNKTDIEFYHENTNIRNKVTPTGRGGNIISGIINFRGDIGYSDLYVKVNGNIHMKIIIEVLPSKIDYKEDYEAILRDVNEEIYNLAYGFLCRTYLAAEI